MAQSTTVSYHSDRCDHTNLVEFDSNEQPWEEKTRGCNSCGTTSQFTKVSDEPDSENDVVQDERTEEQESESNSVEDTDVSEEQMIANADDMDEQTLDNLSSDVEDAEQALDELSYNELQSVAGEFDDVSGSGRSFDDIKYDLVGKARVFDVIEDVSSRTFGSDDTDGGHTAEVNNDE